MTWSRYSSPVHLAMALIGLVCSFGLPSLAADHPVKNSAEITKVLKTIQPGDTITLQDGDWQDAEILFEAQGTPDRPITLRAQTPGQVVIRGRSRLQIAGRHLIVEGLFFHRAYHERDLIEFRLNPRNFSADCRLTNCAIVDCNRPESDRDENSTRWVSIYGSRNRVDHCWIEGKTTVGTTLVVWLTDTPNEHRIDHNRFGPRQELGQNGGETIRVGDSRTSMSVSKTVVEFNCFDRCDGEAEIISNKSCENIYRYNTFLRCSGALTLRHGNRCVVEGNYFLGDKARGTGGVRIIGEGHRVFNNYFERLEGSNSRAALSMMGGIPDSPLHGYFQVKQAIVAFNTFVDCKQTIVVGVSGGNDTRLAPEDCKIANNLIVGRRGPLVDLRMKPEGFRWLGNLVNGEGELGPTDLPGFQRVDSLLEPRGDGLWRLAPSSPAIDSAEGDFPFVLEDIDGQPRTGPKDIGADEYSQAPLIRQPLGPEEVGPTWRTNS